MGRVKFSLHLVIRTSMSSFLDTALFSIGPTE